MRDARETSKIEIPLESYRFKPGINILSFDALNNHQEIANITKAYIEAEEIRILEMEGVSDLIELSDESADDLQAQNYIDILHTGILRPEVDNVFYNFAFDDTGCIGCIAMTTKGDESTASAIAVSKSTRNRGIGRDLFIRGIQQMKENGIRICRISTNDKSKSMINSLGIKTFAEEDPFPHPIVESKESYFYVPESILVYQTDI